MARVVAVLLCLCALTGGGPLNAAYITDKLVAGVFAEPGAVGTPLNLIASGTPVDVLSERGEFTEVRLADDSRGWVESKFVTTEKPARATLSETKAKLRHMGMELAALREQAGEGKPAAGEAQLRQSLQQAEQRIATLQGELAEMPNDQTVRAQLDALQQRTAAALRLLADAHGVTIVEDAAEPAASGGLLQRYRVWIVAAVALAVGVAVGIALIDYRIRKRYGGFRI